MEPDNIWCFGSFKWSTIILTCVAAMVLKYGRHPSVQYFLKFVLYIIHVSTVCLFMIPFSVLSPRNALNVQ